MMQGMEGLEFMLEYQHIYKYGLKYCYLWKVVFSDILSQFKTMHIQAHKLAFRIDWSD